MSSPGGWHFGTKPWSHPTAYRLQCWDSSGQTTHWAEAQPHASADRLPKDFLIQAPLDTPLDSALPTRAPRLSCIHQGQASVPPTRKPEQASRPASRTRGQTPEARKLRSCTQRTTSANAGHHYWDKLAPGPWVTRGVHSWDTQDISYWEPLLQAMETSPATYIKIPITT